MAMTVEAASHEITLEVAAMVKRVDAELGGRFVPHNEETRAAEAAMEEASNACFKGTGQRWKVTDAILALEKAWLAAAARERAQSGAGGSKAPAQWVDPDDDFGGSP